MMEESQGNGVISGQTLAALAAIDPTLYLIVNSRTKETIETFTDYKEACKAASKFRRAGADVAVFKELKS